MTCMLLLVVTMAWPLVGAGPHCDLNNITIPLENEECEKCITITTTSCTGWCFTQDPVYKSSLAPYIQHTCNFKEVAYESAFLPDCPEGVDPHFTYPVALSCECSRCNTDTTDCGALSEEVSGCQGH
uniref:Follicle stimulating hormone n=1 Tax=Arapaima gigas TaxID=113544 RepID=A0A219KYB6_ARAGI|nr:follicle stimulating hormone [Arapaima gigas]